MRTHHFLSMLLCLSLFFNEVHAQQIHPGTRIVQISPEQMNLLLKDPSIKSRMVVLTEEEQKNPEKKVEEVEEEEQKKREEEKKKEEEKKEQPQSGGNGMGNIFQGMDGNGVVIIIAIVGVVMVVVWLTTFPIMLYRAIAGKDEFNRTHFLTLNFSVFAVDDDYKSRDAYDKREGNFLSTKYSLFLQDKNRPDPFQSGLVAELGHYTFRDKDEDDNNINHAHGQYWALGPAFLWSWSIGERLAFLKLDLTAGSSFNAQFGLFSKADVSLNFEVTKGFSVGFGGGGVYMRVKEVEGVERSTNDLGYFLGANTSFQF